MNHLVRATKMLQFSISHHRHIFLDDVKQSTTLLEIWFFEELLGNGAQYLVGKPGSEQHRMKGRFPKIHQNIGAVLEILFLFWFRGSKIFRRLGLSV